MEWRIRPSEIEDPGRARKKCPNEKGTCFMDQQQMPIQRLALKRIRNRVIPVLHLTISSVICRQAVDEQRYHEHAQSGNAALRC